MSSQEKLPDSLGPAQDSPVIEPLRFTPHTQRQETRRWRPSRQQWLIGTPLLLSLLIVGFLLLSRSATFITLPAGADIRVTGGLHFKLADAWLLFPGEYQVDARFPGYYPLSQPIQVGSAPEQQFSLSLEKLPGRLKVELTNQEVNAELLIDGEPAGQTGVEIGQLSPGHHTLVVQHPRYLPHQQNLVIEGLDKRQDLQLTLQPAWATVAIVTEPAGATLTVGDEVLGQTPGEFEILQGERQLSLSLEGYKIWQDLFEFDAGETLALPAIRLQKADGVIRLNTQPSGASVTVNGSFLGETPLPIALLPNQTHLIKVFKEGYQEAQQSVSIGSGASREVTVKLVPALGKVVISASRKDAELYVDGRLFGRADQTLELPARPHLIEVKMTGFETFQAEVTPRPELAQQLVVKLRTQDQAKWDKIPAQIKTRTGQALKLFRPNTQFTMGSSRREQGRRSNESLRPVALTRPFYVSPLLVTNADFVQFEKFHSSSHVKGNSLFGNQQPVVNVTWQQAARYCNWLSEKDKLPPFYRETNGVIDSFDPAATGYRLLTETEWTWLARVQDKGMLKYPWGAQLPPSPGSGNYGDRNAASLLGLILPDYADGYPVTSPVGSFAPNDKGIYDLGGNAAEWINDFYSVGTGLSMKTETNPLGPDKGDYHVIRGSSWAHGGMTELRLSYRDYGDDKRNDVGFRIARFVEPEKK